MTWLFTWRYFKAKKSTNAINIISWVSVCAIALGTAALIIVLSVFNGLESLVRSLYTSFYSDMRIGGAGGEKFIRVDAAHVTKLRALSGVKGFSFTIEDKSLLQFNRLQPVMLKGVDSNYIHVNGVGDNLVHGEWNLGTPERPAAVLGSGVESALNIQSDRSLEPFVAYMFTEQGVIDPGHPENAIRSQSVAASGTFKIQQDFDNNYVITNLRFMQNMLGLDTNRVGAIEIALKDDRQAAAVKKNLISVFGAGYLVQTRYEQNQALFGIMRMEKWVIYFVLTLILAVAAFNMVGALTMLVLEKKKDIQVLKALGADSRFIRRIFLQEGLLLGVVGGLSGIALALVVGWAQVKFKLVPLDGNFLIDYYPVKFLAGDLALVAGTILVIGLLASWIPARRAATQAFELKS